MTFTRTFGNAALAVLLGLSLTLTASAAPKTKRPKSAPRKPAAAPVGVTPLPAPASPSVPTPSSPAPVAAAQAGEALLYDGAAPDQAGLTFTPWGNGDVQDSTEVSFSKGHALKIMTLDAYQGAKIAFKTPVDLGDLTADKTRYLTFVLRLVRYTRNFPPPTGTDPTQIPNNPTPVTVGPPPDGLPGNAPALNAPALNAPPADAEQTPAAATTDLPALHSLRFVFALANGTQADVLRPLPDSALGAAGLDQWFNLSIPLSALGFSAGTGGSPLQSITVSGDDFGVMYIGQIKLSHDTTPLTCFAGDQQTVAPDDIVTLKGTAEGGASALLYSWDFDAKNGITDQAEGSTATAQYANAGDYTVTLTVKDADGIKKPATATTMIHVKAP